MRVGVRVCVGMWVYAHPLLNPPPHSRVVVSVVAVLGVRAASDSVPTPSLALGWCLWQSLAVGLVKVELVLLSFFLQQVWLDDSLHLDLEFFEVFLSCSIFFLPFYLLSFGCEAVAGWVALEDGLSLLSAHPGVDALVSVTAVSAFGVLQSVSCSAHRLVIPLRLVCIRSMLNLCSG